MMSFTGLQVQRPDIEPIIYRDLFLFRTLASFLNGISLQKLGCNAELIVDEFGEKLLEELDYTLVPSIVMSGKLLMRVHLSLELIIISISILDLPGSPKY